MASRDIGFWTLQTLAVMLFVAGGGWGAYRLSSHTEEDIPVVRTPFATPDRKEADDLAWRFSHEGIADAVRDSRPDPYVPAEPVIPTETAAEAQPEPEEAVAQVAVEEAWAAPLAAALKPKPRRTPPARSVLKMISLGPAASGFSVGGSASYAAPAASPGSPAPAAAAQPAASAPQAARRAVPQRRAFVSAMASPSAPSAGAAVINQPATDYSETETAPD